MNTGLNSEEESNPEWSQSNDADNFSIPPDDDDFDDELSASSSSTISSHQDYDAGDTGVDSGEDHDDNAEETIAADLDMVT